MAKDNLTFQKPAEPQSVADILDLAKFGGVFAQRREDARKPHVEVNGETYSKEFLRQVIPYLQHAPSQALSELAAHEKFPSENTKKLYFDIGFCQGDSEWDKQIMHLTDGHILHGDQGSSFDADPFLRKLETSDIETMRCNYVRRAGFEAFIAGYSRNP